VNPISPLLFSILVIKMMKTLVHGFLELVHLMKLISIQYHEWWVTRLFTPGLIVGMNVDTSVYAKATKNQRQKFTQLEALQSSVRKAWLSYF
jgi:hypothetical protein